MRCFYSYLFYYYCFSMGVLGTGSEKSVVNFTITVSLMSQGFRTIYWSGLNMYDLVITIEILEIYY